MDRKADFRRVGWPLWGEVSALLLLMGVAAFLRLVKLDALPPGLYRDEAYNGLDALRVLQGWRPIFFEANNGREPLFIYLLAASIGLYGPSPGALRLVSAVVGILTIPALYWLGRELYNRRIALLAATLATGTVWTLNLSRVAFRAVTMPPITALALACLWRGLRDRRLAWMAIGGVFYGLAFYTYLAARFSLLALLLFIIYIAVGQRRLLWFEGWLVFGLLALLVAMPLASYLASHWQVALERARQVSILNPAINQGDLWGTLWRHTWYTLRSFFYRGDFIPRHNVPLRPIFDPLLGTAFAVGVVLALSQVRHEPAWGLALLWLGGLLLPTILAEDAPHMLRGVGILTVLFFFPALGLDALARWFGQRGRPALGWGLVALALLVGEGSGCWAYYRHLQSEAAYYNFEAGATGLAVEVNRFLGVGWQGKGLQATRGVTLPGRRAYLARRLWEGWPSLRYLLAPATGLEILSKEGQAEAKPTVGERVLICLWPYEDPGEALSLLPQGQLISVHEGTRERGDLEEKSRLLYVAYTSQPGGDIPRNGGYRWQEGIQLVGYRLRPQAQRKLEVDLYWRAERPVTQDYSVFCHVLTAGGQFIGQHDGPPAGGYYPTTRWRAGDLVQDRHLALLSRPYVPGDRVLVGLYRWDTMQRLALLDQTGRPTRRTAALLEAP
ncbi:MAG: glycosyltransferase family 39 protein [Anaerolineae bacterium]|nr:glycosyltransferase family 39 protein [Anaerolineae bacterium]